MYEKFGQFIDGKWQQSSSGETYEVINPATEEIIGKSIKANFDIINEVPEMHLLSMKDVYYYIYPHLEDK